MSNSAVEEAGKQARPDSDKVGTSSTLPRKPRSRRKNGQGNSSKPQSTYDPNAWLRSNAAALVAVIENHDLKPDVIEVDSKSGYEIVCSYNWTTDAAPAIYVPGAPPQWNPPALPMQVKADEGGRYIDQNAHRCPEHPFEPMFRAITVTTPSHSFGNVDLITNRNSLRRLLDFVKGKVWDPFRIDLDMIQETLVMTRRERWTKEKNKPRPGQHLGFGSNFEKGFTAPQAGMEDSTSHHCVARYMLGDLDCVVRYEVDACLVEDHSQDKQVEKEVKEDTKNTQQGSDSLVDSLKGLSLGSTPVKPLRQREVQVIQRGSTTTSSRLAELKTKAKAPNISQLIPQLWFGRIPVLVIGRHTDGLFEQISVRDTTEDFRRFEEFQQDNLRKLVDLIKTLIEMTRNAPGKATIVICEPKLKPLALKIYQVNKKQPVIPAELIQVHWKTSTQAEV